MKTRTTELAVGVFVLVAAAALFFLAMRVSGLTQSTSANTYTITASFDNISGLTSRAKVTMSGVSIGRVTKISLDPVRLNAVVEMQINSDVDEISTDSAASILTAGLLGEKYIGIVPGADETYLKNGDEITLTQSSLVLEDLIGKFLFNKATEPTPAATTAEAAPAAAPATDAEF